MSTLIDSDYIIETIKDFLNDHKGDEKSEKLIMAIGAEILEISEDKLMEECL